MAERPVARGNAVRLRERPHTTSRRRSSRLFAPFASKTGLASLLIGGSGTRREPSASTCPSSVVAHVTGVGQAHLLWKARHHISHQRRQVSLPCIQSQTCNGPWAPNLTMLRHDMAAWQ